MKFHEISIILQFKIRNHFFDKTNLMHKIYKKQNYLS